MSLEDPWMTVTLLLPQLFSLPHCDPVPPNPQHPLQVAISSGQAAPLPYPSKGVLGAQSHKGDPHWDGDTRAWGGTTGGDVQWHFLGGTGIPWESGVSLPLAASLED